MLRISWLSGIACAVVVGLSLVSTSSALNIETVSVGNVGNTGELSGTGAGGYGPDRVCGAVDYIYNIGKYEVTTGQYTEFLNAVATTDTYGLYNILMDSDARPFNRGCNIKRSGTPGSYTYSVASDWANRPVNYVSWGDSARFANWLHNGQPTGSQSLATTEDGAYYLNGAMTDSQLQTISRKTDWQWAITSEDEWYKAAYHKNDGVTGNYFDYPTSSDSIPSNVLVEPIDPGNNATYYNNGYTTGDGYGAPYNHLTEVGAHENSESPYGTFDQGGNLSEWIEDQPDGLLRGGSWNSFNDDLLASGRAYGPDLVFDLTLENAGVGFRVAAVPEPASIVMLLFGGVGLLRRRRIIRR